MARMNGSGRTSAADSRSRMYDALAVTASGLCLVHCLLLPLLVIAVPALAATLLLPERFHLWALMLAVPTSLAAVASGYARHRARHPSAIVAPGLVLLAAGALLAPTPVAETALTVAGALTLAIGHAANWRAIRGT